MITSRRGPQRRCGNSLDVGASRSANRGHGDLRHERTTETSRRKRNDESSIGGRGSSGDRSECRPDSHGNRADPNAAAISGELRQWHKVTLTLNGPQASETDSSPNPFTDYRMTVIFTHESGTPRYEVPGYFAADGDAANTSASSGNKWRAHLSPDKTGRWNWRASFVSGPGVAVTPARPGRRSLRWTAPPDRSRSPRRTRRAPDFRAKGRLQYVGKHYLRFAGSGEYFLKAGPDSPETLLAYEDFDGTRTLKTAIHAYAPHAQDWKTGDPTWGKDQGQGADRRHQLPGVERDERHVLDALQRRGRRRQRLAVRRSRRQVPLRRVQAGSVADRLRSCPGEGHLPALQAPGAGERRRHVWRWRWWWRSGSRWGCGTSRPWRTAGGWRTGRATRARLQQRRRQPRLQRLRRQKVVAPGGAERDRPRHVRCPRRSTVATPGASAGCISASWSRGSATSSRSTGTWARRTPRRRRSSARWRSTSTTSIPTTTSSWSTPSRISRRTSTSRTWVRPCFRACRCRTPGMPRTSRRPAGCADRRRPACRGWWRTTSRDRPAPACRRIPVTRDSPARTIRGTRSSRSTTSAS